MVSTWFVALSGGQVMCFFHSMMVHSGDDRFYLPPQKKKCILSLVCSSEPEGDVSIFAALIFTCEFYVVSLLMNNEWCFVKWFVPFFSIITNVLSNIVKSWLKCNCLFVIASVVHSRQ